MNTQGMSEEAAVKKLTHMARAGANVDTLRGALSAALSAFPASDDLHDIACCIERGRDIREVLKGKP